MNDINWQKLFSTYSFLVEFYTNDETYVARCMEFPSPRVSGSTKEEAIKNLQKELVETLTKYKSANGNFPPPVVKEGYKEGPFVREMIRKGSSVEEASA